MALFNYANREITAKIVYYGPGVCGKTSSLQYIHERISPAQRGRLLSLATETDRTIFFDLLPLKLGEIGGFKLRFQLYTVPGQVKYNKTRKLVLQGADAVVFVADSQKNRRDANIQSLQNLEDNLHEQKRQLQDLPLVYAYNKRDMQKILSVEELNTDLNARELPYFPAIAIEGVGVMETLEAISKLALKDMEKRLLSGPSTESAPEEEPVLLSENLLDLTGEQDSEETLSFSPEELDALQLETDLSQDKQESELFLPGEDDGVLETKPIGYDNNIEIEEVEIRQEDIAHTGTLKESEFFNLKEIEEQALRELDEFLEGKDLDAAEEELDFITSDFSKETAPAQKEVVEELVFQEEEAEPASLTFEDDQMPEFSLETEQEPLSDFDFTVEPRQQPSEETDQNIGEELLEFSLDEPSSESEALTDFTVEGDEGDMGPVFDMTAPQEPESPVTSPEESLDFTEADIEFSLDDSTSEAEQLPSFTLEEESPREETSLLSDEEDDLLSFELDDDLQEPDPSTLVPPFLTGDSFQLDFDAQEEEPSIPQTNEPEFETSEFRITDSVKFEMQVGDEISSGTPFEQQLDKLSGDIFTSEEELRDDTFEPEISESAEEEEFQTISDELTRLIVLAKHLYQRGETFRAQHTASDNILAVMMYYSAIETVLKAVASKYETCNPAIASFHLTLESIEEETGKTIAGVKSLRNNIVTMKNIIQLEAGYPDDEECELAARIGERFLSSFTEEFLTIDFTKLSPVLARPEKQ